MSKDNGMFRIMFLIGKLVSLKILSLTVNINKIFQESGKISEFKYMMSVYLCAFSQHCIETGIILFWTSLHELRDTSTSHFLQTHHCDIHKGWIKVHHAKKTLYVIHHENDIKLGFRSNIYVLS